MSAPAEIKLEGVTVELPLLDPMRSFRRELIQATIGGLVKRSNRATSIVALSNLSVHIKAGDRVGLVGPNGAGKSTLLRLMTGALAPARGRMLLHGNISSLLSMGLGLEMEDTGYDNIDLGCRMMGLSKKEMLAKRDEIVAFAELGEFIHLPIRTYSAGMQVRLAFAIATSIEPDILLIDEIIGAGDAQFINKAKARFEQMAAKAQILVLASHAPSVVQEYCNKAMFLLKGHLVFFGPMDIALDAYNEWLAGEQPLTVRERAAAKARVRLSAQVERAAG